MKDIISQMVEQAEQFQRSGLHFEVWSERATGHLCLMWRKPDSRTVWVCFSGEGDTLYYAYHLPEDFEYEYERQQ